MILRVQFRMTARWKQSKEKVNNPQIKKDMNNNRRKQIDDILEQLNPLLLEIESVKDEEQEAYDNLPESMQNGDKGEKMSDAVNNLEYAFDSQTEVIDYLESAKD